MQTKQPAHILAILILCGLLYLTGCMNSKTNDKDDKPTQRCVGVKVHLSLPQRKTGMWDTTFVKKFSDTSPQMLLLPPLATNSDRVGGSATDTIYLQAFCVDKVDSTNDDDDK